MTLKEKKEKQKSKKAQIKTKTKKTKLRKETKRKKRSTQSNEFKCLHLLLFVKYRLATTEFRQLCECHRIEIQTLRERC